MRLYAAYLGLVMFVGALAGAGVQAVGADDQATQFVPPGTFEPTAPRALRGPSAFKPVDAPVESEVRLSAGSTPVSTRRNSGLAGRLQSLRKNDEANANGLRPATGEPVAPASPRAGAFKPPALAAEEVEELELEDELPTETVAPIPSVLKRPAARRMATLPAAETETPAARSPSDAAPVNTSIRTAPSRSGAAPAASASRPAARAQTLAAGASAALSVETNGPKAMTVNKPTTYIVTVANLGVQEASDIYVAVNLPEHVEVSNFSGTIGEANAVNEGPGQRLVWKMDRIAGRGQEKLTLELVPQTAEPIDLNVEWTLAPPMTTAHVEVLEPKLMMALKGPQDVLYGDTAVYQIIVSNPGTGDAEDVVVDLVSADASESDAKKLGTIAAGQQKVIEVNMTASQAGPMAMHFVAKSGLLAAEAKESVMVRRANLQLAVSGPTLVFAGSEATYKVSLTNTGDAPAETVQLGTLLPEGAEYLGGIAGVKPKSSQLVWAAGTLAPGASTAFEFSVLMNNAGNFDLEVQTKAGDLTDTATTVTKVEAVADLKLTVADPQGPKPVGEEVTYEVTLTNRGTKAAKKVAVVINFSEGIEPISVEGATAEVGGGQALCSPILSIEAGASHKLKIKAKADRAGSHVFRAEVRCTDPETRLASEQTTRFFGSGTGTTTPAAAAPAVGQFVPSTSAKPMTLKRR